MDSLFKALDRCFYCLQEINERVGCYKVSLGGIMREGLEGLKKGIDGLLLGSLRMIEEHRLTNDQIMEKNLEAVNRVLEEKKFYEQRTKELLLYCEVLKEQKDYFKKNLDASKLELDYLQKHEEQLVLKLTGGEDIFSKKDGLEEHTNEANKRDILGNTARFLKSLTLDFGQTINLFSKQHSDRKEHLLFIEDELRNMMIGEKTNKECQVNELELKWGVENIANLDVIQNEFYENSVKLKGSGINFESKLSKLKANDNMEKLELKQIDENDGEQGKMLKGIADQNQANDGEGENGQNGEQTGSNQATQGASTQTNQGTSTQANQGTAATNSLATDPSKVDSWKLPLSMLVFLNTVFNLKTAVKITPWLNLKKTIFDIYENRVNQGSELEAAVGGSFITMDEYVCLYFLNVGFY